MNIYFLDSFPIWLIYLVLGLGFWASVEGGYILGEKRQRSTEYVDEGRSSQAGIVLGAILGLAGFLLAFTYSMAGSQFDSRRLLVIDDANAIGTAFLRADYLPEPHRTTSRKLFFEYVAQRDTLFTDVREAQLVRAEGIQQELWLEAAAVARKEPTPVTSAYIQALNEVIDLHAKRVNVETWLRTPDMVIAMLAMLCVLMMILSGYLLGLRERRYGFPTVAMIFTYATVFLLVVDLDRPARGLFSVDQAPMVQLRDSIQRDMEGDDVADAAPGG